MRIVMCARRGGAGVRPVGGQPAAGDGAGAVPERMDLL